MSSSFHVRFAPSPTGYLHIGNARVAVLNYLFAKHHNALFSLRFDDTDQERSSPHFVQAIKDDLSWLGLSWDSESSQATRTNIYLDTIHILKNSGQLYPCFDTPEELSLQRKLQTSQGLPPLYNNNKALSLSPNDIHNLIKNGKQPHWRFRLTPVALPSVEWDDLVRGNVRFQELAMSDPVLIREDGCPLYTLTSVIDDIQHKITHVVRGEDHVANTAVQIRIFQALNASPPLFAHIPLLMDENGKPLSKRIGSLSLRQLREEGLLPFSLFSYLAHLGTHQAPSPSATTKDLIANFNFHAFGRASPSFQSHALDTLNRLMWAHLPKDEVLPLLPPHADIPFWNVICHNISHQKDILHWWTLLSDTLLPQPYTPKDEEERLYLATALQLLPSSEWDTDLVWDTWRDNLSHTTGRKGKQLLLPLRLALTSSHHGPSLASLLAYLGYERTKARLHNTLSS